MSGFVSGVFNGIGSLFNSIGSVFSPPDDKQNPYSAVANNPNNQTTTNTTKTDNQNEIDQIVNARRGV